MPALLEIENLKVEFDTTMIQTASEKLTFFQVQPRANCDETLNYFFQRCDKYLVVVSGKNEVINPTHSR